MWMLLIFVPVVLFAAVLAYDLLLVREWTVEPSEKQTPKVSAPVMRSLHLARYPKA